MASNQARFEKLIGSINKRFDQCARKWQPGGTSDWQEEMSDILYSGHAGSWRIGADQAGGKASKAEIAAAASQAADEQSFYLNRFAADLIAGKYVDPDTGDINHDGISARAQMYSGAMRGTANLSWINYSDDDDEFDWVLGAVEDHCDDCPYLAEGSPYTKDSLPTVPGENQTPCLFHCKCHLRRRDGTKSIEPVGSGGSSDPGSEGDDGEDQSAGGAVQDDSEDSAPQLAGDDGEYFEVSDNVKPKGFSKLIRKQQREVIGIFSPEGSLLSAPHFGTKNSAAPSPDEVKLLTGSIYVHNHPSGATFSRQDIVTAAEVDVAELWVSTEKSLFKLVRPDAGWPSPTALGAAYDSALAGVRQREEQDTANLSNNARKRRRTDWLFEALKSALGIVGVEVKRE